MAAHRARGWRNGSTSAWRKIRARQLEAHPVCAFCDSPATEVDHITRLADGGAFADPANLRSLCEWCHDQRHRPSPKPRIDAATGLPLDNHWWAQA